MAWQRVSLMEVISSAFSRTVPTVHFGWSRQIVHSCSWSWSVSWYWSDGMRSYSPAFTLTVNAAAGLAT